ncbi:MAG: bifunctional 3,4-dihydroxy-2-butanone-4-phosphate synthase/GTP cyclohydrolase II [Candidatus Omnitrophica bacterium]|nr:bifunctional 3,4-dihydroxy-2-butanone-4-phosphate synthase/GTP cyclohydrolase II [Candidatus Omnitrophota bacterium]
MFNRIEEIIEDIRRGRLVIIVDDEDRENEGDLIQAAEFATPASINFMATFGRGLICAPLESERLAELDIYPMSQVHQDRFKTAWCMSVDAKEGITTGISAHDRSCTIKTLINAQSTPDDFVKPGHIFPLRARKGGVLVRAGHTEASVDLARLAGLYPAGVICEIMNEDGSMARVPDLVQFAKKHGLKIGTIKDLIEYRLRSERLIERDVTTLIPTDYGYFNLILYLSKIEKTHHLALVKGNVGPDEAVLVRVHSECLTGDVFGSHRCDCGWQLKRAMEAINREGKGVILYMRQEGRGIGLVNKLRAYLLQDEGHDTVEANQLLGFKADLRDYGIGAQILVDLGLKQIKLMTNNPKKVVGLEGYGLDIIATIPIQGFVTPHNERYLKTKKEKLGHTIQL